MGPKKAENASKARRLSQHAVVATDEQDNQKCVGKFAADLEMCCRDTSSGYPISIPVYIRGHLPLSFRSQYVSQQLGTPSGASGTVSIVGGNTEEQLPSQSKQLSRGRTPSISHSGILAGVDSDNKSITPGQEGAKSSLSHYKTFHLLRDGEFFRPKLLADSINNENEPIDQINALYMRAWQLDQRFIDILKKILPLQEHLHTLNFSFVGLYEQTLHGFIELCQSIKNLKTVSLDGNPLAADHFHILIEKEELKIVHLSLRFCNITDISAEHLAHALGNLAVQNSKLLTLTLSGNRIGDDGAKSFAKALRYNRTLISLNLSSNFITDKGACAIALVLRKIVLTEEETIYRRRLLSERYEETHLDDIRNNAPSPSLSTISTKSRSGRDTRTDTKRTTDTSKRRKSISTKSTDKRHRQELVDENRPPSASKNDQKKGKNDSNTNRSSSLNPRRAPNEQGKTPVNARKKKLVPGAGNSSRKSISMVKEEDEDLDDEDGQSVISLSGKLPPAQISNVQPENPLLEMDEAQSHKGEIVLKGNLVLLNLNLSRNYLTSTSVNEFLISIQTQARFINMNDIPQNASTNTPAIEFTGLSRLELKGMNDVSAKSSVYQSLEMMLVRRNPLTRLQRLRDLEAKELLEQQPPIQLSQQTIPDKIRASSSTKSTSQRPTSRLKDGN